MKIANWFNLMVARAAVAARREEGQTMVEYGLIIAVIALVVVVAMTGVATALTTKFGSIASALNPT